jgi:hypothetical protein
MKSVNIFPTIGRVSVALRIINECSFRLSKVGVLTAPYSIGEDTNRGQFCNWQTQLFGATHSKLEGIPQPCGYTHTKLGGVLQLNYATHSKQGGVPQLYYATHTKLGGVLQLNYASHSKQGGVP